MTDPLTLQELLIGYGPYLDGEAPTDTEMFSRLDQFGEAFWRIESRTQREYAAQTWADYLANNVLPAPSRPWRIVQEAITAGNVATEGGSWRWYSDAELAELPPTADLVSGHITESGLVLLYGPTGHGKTHISLDAALCVGTGTPWHGHSVKQGSVAYIIAEGIGGVRYRVEAWKEYHGWTGTTNVKFLPRPVHLLEPTEAARIVTDLGTWDPAPRFVVVDTLAWCLTPGGNENSPEHMGAYVQAIDQIRATTGATVLTNHHTGHDTSRERGHTSLNAAMDTTIQVKMDADEAITLKCDKQRESAPFSPLHFRLKYAAESVVPVICEPTDEPDRFTKGMRTCLETLVDITPDDCNSGVAVTTWLKCMPEGSKERTFYHCCKRLDTAGYVEKVGKMWRLTDKGRTAIALQ